MFPHRRLTLRLYGSLLAACALLAPAPAFTAGDDVQQLLIKQGEHWQKLHDSDRAADAWQRLLEIDSRQPDALYGMGMAEVERGNLAKAGDYLARLRKVESASSRVALLDQEIRLGSEQNKALLAEARALVDAGENAKALDTYRRILGGAEPQGDLALDYYTLLGYSPGGAKAAMLGLQNLEDQGGRYALALALLQIENSCTRAEGVRRLQRLVKDPEVGSQANEQWRNGLIWLGSPPPRNTLPLFRAYLAMHPDDTEIRRQLEKRQAGRSRGKAAARAAAEPRKPQDLCSSEGTRTIATGKDAGKESAIGNAPKARPKNLTRLAALQADGGDYEGATATYHEVLAAHPKDRDAWRGLVGALIDGGHLEEALQLLDEPPADLREPPAEMAQLRGRYNASVARAAERSGDKAAAAQAWGEAVRDDPASPWYRLALAQSLLEAGHSDQAQATIDTLLESSPDSNEALYAAALFAAQRQKWSEAQRLISRIPAAQRTAPMQTLEHRAVANMLAGQAVDLAAQGKKDEALAALRSQEEGAAGDDEVLGVVAAAYDQVGEPESGLGLLRARMRTSPPPSPGLRIQYAGMLLKNGHDAEYAEVMDDLGRGKLNGAELASYSDLRRLDNLRQADALRERGELSAAEKLLEPILAQWPDDPQAVAAMARLRVAQGRGAEALALYQPLLLSEPRNPDVLLGAAFIEAQLGEKADARALADRAVAAAPDKSEVLLDAARVYRATGSEKRAVGTYEAAIAAGADGAAASKELADLRTQRSPVVTAGLFARGRNGAGGVNQLTAIEAPIEARLPLGDGRLVARLTPVRLDAGSFASNANTASTFGFGPLVALNGSALVTPQGSSYETGVGIGAGYEIGGLKTDIGSSPLGFRYKEVVGGVSYAGMLGNKLSYSLSGERRSLTDSLLSWSGTRDPRGGIPWGGVTRNGGVANLSYDFGHLSLYGYGGYDWLKGHQVLDNHRYQLGAGMLVPLIHDGHRYLLVGLAASLLSYANNQNFYTYGHGGYFSPQLYFSPAVPVTWGWRNARLSYRVDASLGVQRVHQDGATFFPTDPSLQQQAETVLATPEAGAAGLFGANYASGDSTGLAYNFAGAAEYKITDKWVLGGVAGSENSSNYSQWNVGLYLRYRLQPDIDLLDLPITPFRSPYPR